MLSRRWSAAFVALISACGPSRTVERRSASSASDSQPRLVAVAVAVQGDTAPAVPPASDRLPAVGDDYRRAVIANLLRDARGGSRVLLKPGDETDTTNFAMAGWRIGVDANDLGRVPVRFFANYDRYRSGVLVITLDTTLDGHRFQPPFESKTADSIAIPGLERRERLAMTCRFGAHDADERIIGVVRGNTRERWMPARLAWFLDTASVRIRPMRPESVTCNLAEDPD